MDFYCCAIFKPMKDRLTVFIFLVAILLVGAACQGEPENKQQDGPTKITVAPDSNWLEVRQAHFKLREEPGTAARALQELEIGARVLPLGEQSTTTTALEFQNQPFTGPWLLVELENGTRGWAFSLAFLEMGQIGEGLPTAVRLRSLFGEELVEQAQQYKEAVQQANTAEALIQAMAMGNKLRDTLVEILALRGEESNSAESLFWLKDALPAFIPHRLKNGYSYYLFWDYRPLLVRAQQTEGAADDAFLELCLLAYPEDSIEYFHPSWVFESGENEVHSLLGRGLHFRILENLDKLLTFSDLLEEEIGQYKGGVLNDILGADVTYWESRDKALEELEKIIEAKFEVLGPDVQQALQTRQLQFEDPERYGIKFNYRSGIYE